MSLMKSNVIVSSLLAASLCASPALAQDPREDEMFGEEDVVESFDDEPDASGDSGDRDDAIFGGSGDDGLEPVEEPSEDVFDDIDEQLAIGGFYLGQFAYNLPEGLELEDQTLSAPNLLDVYMDARPNDRLRFYARGRLVYSPALAQQEGGGGELGANAGLFGATGIGAPEQLQAQLDQLWLKFDLGQAVYFTLGRQRVRWGASRFFNPTDFLNDSQINPIAIFDARLGVDMLKVHVPIGELNLYGYALFGGAQNPQDVGGALRLEALVGPAEVTVSMLARRQVVAGPQPIPNPLRPNTSIWEPSEEWPKESLPLRLGADVSAPLGPLDVKLELALSRGLVQPFWRGRLSLDFPNDLAFPQDYTREDELIVQAVASFEWLAKYNDEDLIVLGAEYFYNGAGYENADLYLWTLLQGGFRPLYMGQHYVAGAIALPGPGTLDDVSFTLSTIANLSDRSALSRFDTSVTILSELSLNAYAQYHWGEPGEFRFGVDVPGAQGLAGLEGGISVPAPFLVVGAGARVSF